MSSFGGSDIRINKPVNVLFKDCSFHPSGMGRKGCAAVGIHDSNEVSIYSYNSLAQSRIFKQAQINNNNSAQRSSREEQEGSHRTSQREMRRRGGCSEDQRALINAGNRSPSYISQPSFASRARSNLEKK